MLSWFNRRGKSSRSYSNEEWVESLRPPPDEVVIMALRNHLIIGLRSSLHNYVKRDLNDFVEDITQDSVLKILDKLESFNGESAFTTWAMKVAVREGYTELRKKRYKDISLEQYSSFDPDKKQAVEIKHEQAGPDQAAHESMLVQKVMKIMQEELSDKQQKVIQHLMIDQIPMTVVAEMMDSNRNAIYKLVHDARLKLKKRLELEGIDPEDILQEM